MREGGTTNSFAGTSASSPILAGGVGLMYQLHQQLKPNHSLNQRKITYALRKSSKKIDDPYSGRRYFVADFQAAANYLVNNTQLMTNPSKWTDHNYNNFNRISRMSKYPGINDADIPYFLDPLRFKVTYAYPGLLVVGNHLNNIDNKYKFTAPTIEADGQLHFNGKISSGEANVSLLNKWGDPTVANLSENSQNLLTYEIDYQAKAHNTSVASNRFLFGIKEMYGSNQFVSKFTGVDSEDSGRIAVEIENIGDQLVFKLKKTTALPLIFSQNQVNSFAPRVWTRSDAGYWGDDNFWDYDKIIFTVPNNNLVRKIILKIDAYGIPVSQFVLQPKCT